MGMKFNLTVIYGSELPEGDWEHLEGDGLEIHGEGELGSRQFIGKSMDYFDSEHVCTAPFELSKIDDHVVEKLTMIAIENDLAEPQVWTVGGVS